MWSCRRWMEPETRLRCFLFIKIGYHFNFHRPSALMAVSGHHRSSLSGWNRPSSPAISIYLLFKGAHLKAIWGIVWGISEAVRLLIPRLVYIPATFLWGHTSGVHPLSQYSRALKCDHPPGIEWQVIACFWISAASGVFILHLELPETGDHDIFPGLKGEFHEF